VPISYFFNDNSEGTMCSLPSWISRGGILGALNRDQIKAPIVRLEALELLRTYYTNEKLAVRKRIAEMVKSIATMLAGE
jgi:predicted hydrolase (HD superfamily)